MRIVRTSGYRLSAGSCEHCSDHLGAEKAGKLIGEISWCQLPMNDFTG